MLYQLLKFRVLMLKFMGKDESRESCTDCDDFQLPARRPGGEVFHRDINRLRKRFLLDVVAVCCAIDW
jgi:hypothetical protein